MRCTPNEMMGSIIYRASQILNEDEEFLNNLKDYYFSQGITHNGKVNLWHFPGTQQEIAHVFQTLGKDSQKGSKLKYPAVLSFQSIPEDHEFEPGLTRRRYNLAIIAPVESKWFTQEREAQVYKLLLRPIEDALIKAVKASKYLQNPIGRLSYTSVYIPTTGNALNSIMKVQYGDYIDAIELPSFTLKVISNICDSMSAEIIKESEKVTDEIKNLI